MNAKTSWESAGSGSDAEVKPMMWVWIEQNGFKSLNTLTAVGNYMQMVFAADDAAATVELGTVAWTLESGVEVTNYWYQNLDSTIDDAKDSGYFGGSNYKFILATDSV